ncbi:MAG: hypothetical protein KF852_18255 [Saprospiraceae bacterium]|nr:hypothetical protein [Saprospiraceae bacterium]
MITVLFWICWVIDLLLCAIAIIGKGFANSFHPDSSVPWLAILLVGCTVGGFLLQVLFKKPVWALMAAALPLAVLLGMYVFEEVIGRK